MERDPERWEKLDNGMWLQREDALLTPAEEAEFYGRGELKAFTRPPRPKADPPGPPSPP